MKKSILTFLIAILCLSIQAQTPIYRFPFDNSLTATIGIGTFASGAHVTFTADRFGNANSAVNINNNGTTSTLAGLPLAATTRTISLWVKMDTILGGFNFMYNYGTAGNPEGAYLTQSQAFHFAPSHSRSSIHNTTSWYHYVFTYDGTASRIYLNGTLLGFQNVAKNTANNANLFRLGLTETGGGGYFKGSIDDLRVYNVALTAPQVSALFTDCVPPTPVSTTPTANLSLCSGATTSLTVQSDSVVNWFDVPTGGVSLGTGNSFATPVLNASATYYAEAGTACKSARLPIAVNVLSTATPSSPQILSDTSIVFCEGITTTLSVQSADSVRWYDAPTGGNLIGTGKNFTTPTLQSTATYYAEAFNACATPQTSARTAVKVKVNGSFPISNNTPPDRLFVCSGNNVQLFASATGADTIRWTLDGNFVSSNNVLTISALTQPRTYVFTAIKNGVCTQQLSYPIQIHTPFGTAPTNTSGTLPALCQRDSITLSATSAHNAPLYWFTTASGGTSFASGDTIKTEVVAPYNSPTVTYYVQSGKDNCASPRTAVPVSVTFAPVGAIFLSGTTITANNLFDTYVLKRDGQTVAQSNSTGTFTFNNATCGDYQAEFTNTVNSISQCGNSVVLKVSKNSTVYGSNCYTFYFSAAGIPGTVEASVAGGPFGSTSYYDGTQVGFITNVCGVSTNTSIAFRYATANGCTYQYSNTFNNIPATNQTTHNNVSFVTANSVGLDTLTTCSIRSNIVTVGITAPTITTPVNNRSACFGGTATLAASGTGTLNWYNQPTGGTILGTGTSFTTPAVTANTTYYVESNSGNCTSTRTAVSVTLTSSPTAAINPTSATICLGEAAQLVASGGGSYAWSGSLGSSSNISVSPSATATYTVTITNSNGCSATASASVTVKPTSATPLSQTVCFGQTTTFKGQTITQSGNYHDTLTNVEGCDSIITLNFTVRNRAEQTINAGICNGQSYTFKGQTLTQAGQYFDTLQTTLGCDSFVTLNLSVNSFVTGTASASICQGESYFFNGQQLTQGGQYLDTLISSGGCDSIVTLTLTINSFVTGTASAAICQGENYTFNGQQLTQGGQYLDTLVSSGGCDSILTLTLTVNPLPQPTITRNGNVLSTQVYTSYDWYLNSGAISNATNQTHALTQNGDYTVLVTDGNGCSAFSPVFNVTGVGINDLQLSDIQFMIYPNPTENIINIEISSQLAANRSQLQILDMQGRVIIKETFEGKAAIDVSGLAANTYQIKISNGASTAVKRFIKL